MAFGRPFRTLQLTADSPALQGPLIYHGGLLLASAGGAGQVDVYDGNSASGAPLDQLRANASDHDVHTFDAGIFVSRGIFVDFGSNVSSYVLYYDLDEAEANTGPRQGP